MDNERFVDRNEALTIFQVSAHQFHRWTKIGRPWHVRKQGYPVKAIAVWISQLPQGTVTPRVRQRAFEVLHQFTPQEGKRVETNGELGLEAALNRLRSAEALTHARWLKAIEEGDPRADLAFKDWQQALDQLRKSEGSLLKVLEERKRLLPAGEVRKRLVRMIDTAKNKLLNIPAKVAPQLDGQPWPVIQKTIDKEIRDALRNLSEN